MEKKTVGIIATVLTTLVCGCFSIFTCVWGILLATETPISTNTGDQTFPPTVGYVLLCLTVILLLVPVAVGFFTLRKKTDEAALVVDPVSEPESPAETVVSQPKPPVDDEPLPPASPPAE